MAHISHKRFINLFSSLSFCIFSCAKIGPALVRTIESGGRSVLLRLEGRPGVVALRGPAGAAVHLHEMTSMVSGHGSFFYTQ